MDNVEDLYELSPMQQGMLFHSLYAPGAGTYVEQISCNLAGELNVSLFEQAWQRLVDRHAILRTAFFWEEIEKPVQLVYKKIGLKLDKEDWRGLSPAVQHERLDNYLKADRSRGFDLSKAPLMRLVLVQLTNDQYRFIWTHHHILLDGWCLPLVFEEIFTCYEGLRRGKESPRGMGGAYGKYIAWLRRQDRAAAESFWRKNLDGISAPTPLGINHASGLKPDANAGNGQHEITLSQATTAALNSLAHEHLLTLSTIINGAWAIMLSRYSGEDDIVFGMTVSGRPADLAGVETMLGLFINTLPVRARIVPTEPFLNWLQSLQEDLLELREYEYSALLDIQGWSEIPRGQSLFESIVVFENYPVNTPPQTRASNGKRGLSVGNLQATGDTNYPLTIVVGGREKLLIRVKYDRKQFDADTITRLTGHFQTLLEAFVSDPRQPIALALLNREEREQQLVEWNETAREYEREKCIQQLFEAQVERTPEAVALVYEGKQLSYAELNARANQLAHYLRRLGVGPEVLVGICVERSLEMLVGVLGILKSGGAYVPLDPNNPLERLSFMLDDAAVAVLITQPHLLRALPEQTVPVVCVERDWAEIGKESTANPECLTTAENLCYVIYTSGSTGKPKGVLIAHRNVVHLSVALRETVYKHQSGPLRVSLNAPIFFDGSVKQMLQLLEGHTLHLLSEEVRRDARLLQDYITREKLEVLDCTPGQLRQLLQVRSEQEQPETQSWLQVVLVGGEAIGEELWEQLGADERSAYYNVYGPTECTVDATVGRVRAGEGVHIGRAVSNTEVYVLDKGQELVPVGVVGELYIGGAGLARGYLHQAELTAEKFVQHPFAVETGARLYRTGDLVRYLSDGRLEFVGRVDSQVKVRGYRIELGEVETVLNRHSGVKECVVVAREEESGDKRLVAYVVTASGDRLTASELRSYLKEKLPEYMVPSAFVELGELSLTRNGKVDHRALPAPAQNTLRMDADYVAPRTAVEEMVAGIWSEVLKVERVGATDNFFELGGHSLLATQVISRVREICGTEVGLRQLFERPRLGEFAGSVAEEMRAGAGMEAPPLARVSREGELPLSFAQQRLWFIDQLEPGSHTYNIPAAVRLTGDLNIKALEQTLSEIVRRHESLRTSFTVIDSEPVQVIAAASSLPLPLTDLSAMVEAEREAEARRLAGEEARVPFDLSTGPLFRAQLLRLSETEHILLCTMHHVVSDGWSMGVLIREVAALYQAFSAGEPSPLPELSIQYADFAAWQREWLSGAVLESQLGYWKQQLQGAPAVLELPVDRPRPLVRSYRGARHSFQLSAELSAGLKELSRQEGVTLFMVLLAAFDVLLSRYTGQDDIVVGTPVAGRNHSEIESLIGFFVNTLVLRVELPAEASFREVVRRVREVALGAYAHQDIPFEKLVEELQPERALSHQPLFQVVFTMQNSPREGLVMRNLNLSGAASDDGSSKFDLVLMMWESADRLRGNWTYDTDLFDATTIARMHGHFETLLQNIVARPDAHLGELETLTEAEQKQRLLKEQQLSQTTYKMFQTTRPKAVRLEF